MTDSASVSFLGREFDDFLFAPIGEDRNGMLLTVLSALARVDVDPWQEAAELNRLPWEAASQRLASVIEAQRPSACLDCRAIAARLIPLLPRRARSKISPRETSRRVGAAPMTRATKYVVFCLVLMALALGAQFIIAMRPLARQVNNSNATAFDDVYTQLPLNSDQWQ